MAVRYCDNTTRRSNSGARGSLLSASSTAAPVVQKRRQCWELAANVVATDGNGSVNGWSENATTNSTRAFRPDGFDDCRGVRLNECASSAPGATSLAHACHWSA